MQKYISFIFLNIKLCAFFFQRFGNIILPVKGGQIGGRIKGNGRAADNVKERILEEMIKERMAGASILCCPFFPSGFRSIRLSELRQESFCKLITEGEWERERLL